MKTNHFLLIAICVFFAACGPSIVEVKFDKFDITMSAVAGKKQAEFKELNFDKKIARYDFNIGKRRLNIEEIESAIFPENVKALAEAISAGEKFEGMLNEAKYPNGTIEFPNGAFGVLYSKKGKSGKSSKDYEFYFKKGERCFRLYPVFNSDLEDLEQQLSAIESIK
jgi:hypothetical protein